MSSIDLTAEADHNPIHAHNGDDNPTENDSSMGPALTNDINSLEVPRPSAPTPMKRAVSAPTTIVEKRNAIDVIIDSSSKHQATNEQSAIETVMTDAGLPGVTSSSSAIQQDQTVLLEPGAVTAVPGGGGQLRSSTLDAALHIYNNDLLAHEHRSGALGREVRSVSFARTYSANDHSLQTPRRYPHLHSYSPRNRSPSPAIPLESFPHLENVVKWMNDIVKVGVVAVADPNAASDLEAGLVSSAAANSTAPSASGSGGQDASKDVIETFYCSICFENRAMVDVFQAAACGKQHTYCLPCMSSYATIQVEDGVVDHYCPGVGECHAKLSSNELRLLLFPEAFERWVTNYLNSLVHGDN